ncbi:hypothetical protein [Microbacterium sp. KR10-403]|uniref:hypothetical protein n=1 Tax=Microbacterium sp. KR10-403 TaxID=3158581 RepID=UPI0032E4622C
MTDETLAADRDAPLTDDTLLAERIGQLLERAMRRQFWMLFLDGRDVLAPVVMPCDDLPEDPLGFSPSEDLGEVANAELLGVRVSQIMEEFDLAQAVFVWERRGGPRVRDAERRWARELAGACARAGARVRAQFLLHDRGLRVLAPDDYL